MQIVEHLLHRLHRLCVGDRLLLPSVSRHCHKLVILHLSRTNLNTKWNTLCVGGVSVGWGGRGECGVGGGSVEWEG